MLRRFRDHSRDLKRTWKKRFIFSKESVGLQDIPNPCEHDSTFIGPAPTLSTKPVKDRSADPLGITVLYEPQAQHTADIIFVHGLGGSSLQTWSKDGDPNLRWPQQWLPLEPNICEARILTFGYNALFGRRRSGSVADILDFARSLLFEMKYAMDNQSRSIALGKKPLIFVTHSLGGLVFKQAYVQGICSDKFSAIVKNIHAVIFLSTPHHGTKLARSLNWILSISIFGHSSKRYIRELDVNSRTIREITESFRSFIHNLEIFSFYELQPTPITRFISMKIVGKESAKIGCPGEVRAPLDANHHTVCKFSSPQESTYKILNALLQHLVSSYQTAGR
ncbi:hypothetical protein CPC735_030070 [Coccidioides posadasii C735 delta SOWgp]|uniref:DUF676 domain-containing protein n=1 Tax=Coccidioides posadasii (strain C735) TaxID=222929 RepID=C5P4N1_COCP7|nr:hypothetical protein CPC735_030070 [Coccidioides posadasii C735 delta SOWgp]EER27671.1 hypothetical protein CPC735_030070 [Coccidioides posadasii C735 delta SOWgp]|eukprot:XP_003069816.1 hypothetical protein CPC735_030070 [Coccidioides posadasii C735 delta SOWgp]